MQRLRAVGLSARRCSCCAHLLQVHFCDGECLALLQWRQRLTFNCLNRPHLPSEEGFSSDSNYFKGVLISPPPAAWMCLKVTGMQEWQRPLNSFRTLHNFPICRSLPWGCLQT